MILGNKSNFGIDLPDENQTFCTCLLWINNAKLGDPTQIGVRGALSEALTFLSERTSGHEDEALFAMNGDMLLRQVLGAIFGTTTSLAESGALNARYGRFLLSPNFFPSLDDYAVVIVGNTHMRRIVAGDLEGKLIEQAELRKSDFQKVIDDAVRYLSGKV